MGHLHEIVVSVRPSRNLVPDPVTLEVITLLHDGPGDLDGPGVALGRFGGHQGDFDLARDLPHDLVGGGRDLLLVLDDLKEGGGRGGADVVDRGAGVEPRVADVGLEDLEGARSDDEADGSAVCGRGRFKVLLLEEHLLTLGVGLGPEDQRPRAPGDLALEGDLGVVDLDPDLGRRADGDDGRLLDLDLGGGGGGAGGVARLAHVDAGVVRVEVLQFQAWKRTRKELVVDQESKSHNPLTF